MKRREYFHLLYLYGPLNLILSKLCSRSSPLTCTIISQVNENLVDVTITASGSGRAESIVVIFVSGFANSYIHGWKSCSDWSVVASDVSGTFVPLLDWRGRDGKSHRENDG